MTNDECKSYLPLDIKPNWLNVIRRMQSIASTGGLAIVSISVLVDQNGNPRLWTEPQCKRIEPKKATEDILQLLTDSHKNAFP